MSESAASWTVRTRREREVHQGLDWLLRGMVESEAGVDLLLTSRAEPIPGFAESLGRIRGEFDESGISTEEAESDTITAGLLRAALLARRRVVGLFELRGFRQAVDAVYDAAQIRVNPRSGGVLVVCHCRWNFGRAAETGRPASGWQATRRTWLSDPRDLAALLDVPLLAPAAPAHCARSVNEAMRLSRVAGSLVMLYLSPLIMGGGETEALAEDAAQRTGLSAVDPRGEDRGTPLQVEVRRRRLDQLFNAPLPGEVVPFGFITFGSAHGVLRHALSLLGLTGRLPILRLGCANPFDPLAVGQFLTRCERVVVVENGRDFIEQGVHLLAAQLRRQGDRVAEVYGKSLPPAGDGPPGSIAFDIELHPCELAESLGPRLGEHRAIAGHETAAQRLEALLASRPRPGRLAFERTRPSTREPNLLRPLIDAVIDDLRDELSVAAPDRPAAELKVEPLETATLERPEGQRQIIEMERRRVPTVGRSAITHAILRRHETTFLVLPDAPDRPSGIEPADVDRLARSMVSERESRQLRIVRTDPTDLAAFARDLRSAVLGTGVSVVIIDPRSETSPENIGGPSRLWAEGGLPPVESTVIPSSPRAALAYAWLVRRGWTHTAALDGVHGPRLYVPDAGEALETPLDAWHGFEEYRLHRKAAGTQRAASAPASTPTPVPRHQHLAAWHAHLCGRGEEDVAQALRLIESAGRRMGYRLQVLAGRAGAGWFAHLTFTHPRPTEPAQPITPRVPWGAAHLIIAMDFESLVESIEFEGRLAVASPGCTSLVLDLSPAIAASFDERETSSRYVVPGELNAIIPPVERLVLRAGEVCERRLKSRREVAATLVGAAYQRGLIPVTENSLADAAAALDDQGRGRQRQALALGRALAAASSEQASPDEPTPPSPESLVRLHAAIMSRRWGPARGNAATFRLLALGTLDAITGLRRTDPNRVSERRFIARLIDCEYWGGLALAQHYANAVRSIYAAERSPANYPITRLAIEEIARALLIADGPFVARTALRRDRRRRLMRDLGADRPQGDAVTLRVRGQVRQAWARSIIGEYWSLGPAGLRLLAASRWARIIPTWHRKDRDYRQWIITLARQCADDLPERASLWLEIFRQLTRVRGSGIRRDVRLRHVRTAVQSVLELAGPRGREPGSAPPPPAPTPGAEGASEPSASSGAATGPADG